MNGTLNFRSLQLTIPGVPFVNYILKIILLITIIKA